MPAFGLNGLALTSKHRISGLVVEYIVAIDVTRARFPADAYSVFAGGRWKNIVCKKGEQKECVFAQAAIAQLGERQTEDLKVPGSIPGLGILHMLLRRTIISAYYIC